MFESVIEKSSLLAANIFNAEVSPIQQVYGLEQDNFILLPSVLDKLAPWAALLKQTNVLESSAASLLSGLSFQSRIATTLCQALAVNTTEIITSFQDKLQVSIFEPIVTYFSVLLSHMIFSSGLTLAFKTLSKVVKSKSYLTVNFAISTLFAITLVKYAKTSPLQMDSIANVWGGSAFALGLASLKLLRKGVAPLASENERAQLAISRSVASGALVLGLTGNVPITAGAVSYQLLANLYTREELFHVTCFSFALYTRVLEKFTVFTLAKLLPGNNVDQSASLALDFAKQLGRLLSIASIATNPHVHALLS